MFKRKQVPYFSDSYDEARERFHDLIRTLRVPNSLTIAESYPSLLSLPHWKYLNDAHLMGVEAENFVSVIHLEPKTKKNLVVIISGLHGIEGFVGSALQSMFLDKVVSDENEGFPASVWDHTGVVLIHDLNPYGFRECRRTNMDNIDLNRAFISDIPREKIPVGIYYHLVHETINTHQKLSTTRFYQRLMNCARLLRERSGQGRALLQHIIASGQYIEPMGLFYGGVPGQENETVTGIKAVIDTAIERDYETIFLIDIHSGYGRWTKKGKVFCMIPLPEQNRKFQWYAKHLSVAPVSTVPQLGSDAGYPLIGDMSGFMERRYNKRGQVVYPVMLEFPTLQFPRELCNTELLKIMVAEQWAHFYLADPEHPAYQRIKRAFREAFYPSDQAWRQFALNQGRKIFSDVLHTLHDR